MHRHLIFLSFCVFSVISSTAAAQDNVASLISELRTGNTATKVAAAIKLAELGPDAASATPELVKALHVKDEDLRLNAALALGKIGKAAVSELSKALVDERIDVRYYAIWALGWIGPDAGSASPLIIKALSDKDDNIRRKAVYTLGRIAPKPETAIPVLIKAFADSNAEVRQAAGEAVGKLGASAVPALRTALKDDATTVRLQAVRALGEIGPDAKDAVADLAALFADKDIDPSANKKRDIRAEAGNALVKVGKAAVPTLTALMKSDSPDMRGQSIETLARIGAPAASVLVDGLGSDFVDVRRQVARNLGWMRIGDKMVVIGLAHALKDKDATVRRHAAQSLQIIGPGAHLAAKDLLAALNDPDASVRQQVLFALNNVRGDAKEMVPTLVKLLNDSSAAIRKSAVSILSRYGAPALPHILSALKDTDAGVRQQAIFALQSVQGDLSEALPLLLPLMKEDNPNTRRAALTLLGRAGEKAVPHLREFLKDPSPQMRWAAVSSLGDLGPAAKKAIPELVDLAAGDANVTVRRFCMAAVVRIDPEEVGPLYEKIKKHPDVKFRQSAFLFLGVNKLVSPKVAVGILVDGLKDKESRIRQISAQALGRLGPAAKSAIEPLMNALNDPDPIVRSQVQAALRQIKEK